MKYNHTIYTDKERDVFVDILIQDFKKEVNFINRYFKNPVEYKIVLKNFAK